MTKKDLIEENARLRIAVETADEILLKFGHFIDYSASMPQLRKYSILQRQFNHFRLKKGDL